MFGIIREINGGFLMEMNVIELLETLYEYLNSSEYYGAIFDLEIPKLKKIIDKLNDSELKDKDIINILSLFTTIWILFYDRDLEDDDNIMSIIREMTYNIRYNYNLS